MKLKITFILLFVFLISMTKNSYNAIVYRMLKGLSLNIGTIYNDYEDRYRFIVDYPYIDIDLPKLGPLIKSMHDKLTEQNIDSYFMITAPPQVLVKDKSKMGLNSLQSNILMQNIYNDTTEYRKFMPSNTVIGVEVAEKYAHEFNKLSEQRWIRQDGHWSEKHALVNLRELFDLMELKHDFSNITYIETNDGTTTETIGVYNGIPMNLHFGRKNLTIMPREEKVKYIFDLYHRDLDWIDHYAVKNPNALNKKTVLFITSSYTEMALEYIAPLFTEFYFFRAVDIDIQQFIDDKNIDTVVLEMNYIGPVIPEFKKIENRLR